MRTLKHEASFKDKLVKLFSAQEAAVVANVEEGQTDIDRIFNAKREAEKFEANLEPLITRTLTDSFNNPPQKPIHQRKYDWSGLSQVALDWIKDHSLEMAQSVTSTTKDKLRVLLAEGFESGDSVKGIADRIRDYYAGCKKGRAEMVARTETIAASSNGTLYRYSRDGCAQAEFMVAKDERTCDECMMYSGEKFPIDGSHAMIPVHPNCRCCWLPVNLETEKEEYTPLAREIYSEAHEFENAASSMLKSLVDRTEGEFRGFAFRYKSVDSISRKLVEYRHDYKGVITDAIAKEKVTDALRYTIVYSDDMFGLQVIEAQKRLKKAGFKPFIEDGEDKLRNYFVSTSTENGVYKGYNTVYQNAAGKRFELQFHTAESYRLKEKAHIYLEEFRVTTDEIEKKIYREKMIEMWKFFKLPKYIDLLPGKRMP